MNAHLDTLQGKINKYKQAAPFRYLHRELGYLKPADWLVVISYSCARPYGRAPVGSVINWTAGNWNAFDAFFEAQRRAESMIQDISVVNNPRIQYW